jgi:hypothetical protein
MAATVVIAGTVVIVIMAEVILNETGMKEKKRKHKIGLRTPVQACISTEG